MQAGDLVKIKAGWSLKGRMGVITKYVKKKSLPDSVQVYIPNPPPERPSNWAWMPYYELEVLCKQVIQLDGNQSITAGSSVSSLKGVMSMKTVVT